MGHASSGVAVLGVRGGGAVPPQEMHAKNALKMPLIWSKVKNLLTCGAAPKAPQAINFD